MDDIEAEKRNLRYVYGLIADVWEHLPTRPLNDVVEFCLSIKSLGKVLDIGCNNSRNLVPFAQKKFLCIGLDFSKKMIAKSKSFFKDKRLTARFIVADVDRIPLKNNSVDYVLCTRVLHHIPTRSARLAALANIKRVTRRKILLTVYRRYFPQFFKDFFSNLFSKKYEFGDVYKKWTHHNSTYKRFYHLYSLDELERELNQTGLTGDVHRSGGSIVARVAAKNL
jgi:ubiquinone/menaquinone biosynthesis C-methylase UbiE